ncbi:hypothetical protein LXA43DRAFT_896724 [Ganoderma leucocontextum]|nr:hypothetical protein LXA43DRAFT_896724 [Ganoderma leucocontextum]
MGRRITYDTPLPFAEVIACLDQEINKAGGGPEVFHLLSTVQTRAELEDGINTLTAGRQFVYVRALSMLAHVTLTCRALLGTAYHKWLNAYNGTTDTPQTYGYVLGNPLIAQTMLRHDLTVVIHVPPKIVIVEKADGSGTRVTYDNPASVIAVPTASGERVDPELAEAAVVLSGKFEALIQRITKAD